MKSRIANHTPDRPVFFKKSTLLPLLALGALTVLAPLTASAQTRMFAPYIDMSLGYDNDNLAQISQQSGIKDFTLAFIVSDSSGNAEWGGIGDITADTSIAPEINALRAQGGDVIISFGGEAGTELAIANTNVSSLQAQYQAVINKYNVKSLDFDVEGSAVDNTSANDRRNQAIAGLQSANPGLTISYTLPVATTGLLSDAIALLQNAKSHGVVVSCVNIMAMDFGSSYTGDMGAYAIGAANATISELASNGLTAPIGLTLLIGGNDTKGEIFTTSDATSVENYAVGQSQVNRLTFWEVPRDIECPGDQLEYDSNTCSGVTQTPWQFSQIFEPFGGTGIASSPTFNPAGGTYTSAQSVTISDSTSGATIYYTTNGSTPTTSSTVYSSPISVSSGTVTIEAIGAANGINSSVSSATYTISSVQQKVATPTFSPAAGTYTSAVNVSISDATSGATIYYTTNGTTPTTSSTAYSSPISVSSGTVTIEAIGVESGFTNSSVASATYTISQSSGCVTATMGGSYQNSSMAAQTGTFTATCDATPTASPTNAVVALSNGAQTSYSNFACLARFNPSGDIDARNGGAYAAASTIPYSANVSYHFRLVVNVSAQTYSIYVTPAGGSELTVGLNYAFRISDTTLNNWAVYVDSGSGGAGSVAVCNFSTGGGAVAAPTFSPGTGTYDNAQTVTISDSTSGASIYYTIDGSTPSPTNGTLYSGPVSINSITTLKAMGHESGFTDSSVATATYTMVCAAPTFSPGSGTYTGAQSVSIGDATVGATIYYTTDGTTPTTSSAVYSGPITISSTATLQAIAVKTGYLTGIANASYTISGPVVATPTFSPAAGTYSSSVSVTISDATSGATIYYTTNNTTPTTSSAVYGGPISVSSGTVTIEAIAAKSGDTNSSVASATYTIGVPPPPPPTFSPAGGTYTSAQNVTISFTPSGATVYYTTNGTTPTTSSTVYSSPIPVSSGTVTIEAITVSNGVFSSVATVTYTISSGTCVTATMGGSYQNSSMTAQTGTFTFTCDATPTASPTNAVVALSNGAQTSYSNFACLARFNPSGDIDARNGGAYAAASTIPYSANVSYHFRLVVNVSAQTYSIYVTPAGGSELTVGLNYAFRISDTTLNNWAVYVDSGSGGAGSVAVCNFSTGGTLLQVATPTFSPAAGTYSSAQSVTISDNTSGATIYYTTNGTTPTTSSTVYSSPISVSSGSVTIEAIGAKSGYTNSAVASPTTYTIGNPPPVVATPTFSPGAGTYSSVLSVTLSDATSGATIYYTTNGTVPTTSSTVYSSPISISGGAVTIEAIAAASGMTNSVIASATYTISIVTPQVATPTFSPGSGTYTSAVTVTLSDATSGATIYYTTNGATPTTSSAVYSSPISVGSGTVTIKAIGAESGMTNSSVASATYTIATQSGNIAPNGTAYSWDANTSATANGNRTAQPGLNNNNPADVQIDPNGDAVGAWEAAGIIWSSPVSISSVDFINGDIDSGGDGFLTANLSLQFSTDGSTWTSSGWTVSPVYPYGSSAGGQTYTFTGSAVSGVLGARVVGQVRTTDTSYLWILKQIQVTGGSSNGGGTATTPTFSPGAGMYSSAQNVTISTTTSGASIRYTTDGSTPSETAGTLYSGPVNISATATLNAIAYKSGDADSSVASAIYNIGSGGNFTAAQVLAAVQSHMTSSVQVNTEPHINTMTRAMNVNVYQVTSGVFAYTSSMAIDDDGSDPDPDPDHQNQTTWQDSSGAQLGAHHVPFYVLGDDCWDNEPKQGGNFHPCPHFFYSDWNITGLQFALIFYNGNCIGAVFGDTQGTDVTSTSNNDARELGEASVESAFLLGILDSGTTGGVDNGVTVVIFSGPQWVVQGTNEGTGPVGSATGNLNGNAQALVQKALNQLGTSFGL